jgi:hypothetical protein
MRKTPGVIGSLQRSTRRSSATDWPSSGVIVLAERLELLDILSIIVDRTLRGRREELNAFC